MSGRSDESFLGRWSKRKRADPGAEDGRPEDGRRPDEALAGNPAESAADNTDDKTDAELLEELGLPDPDDLTEGDDFKRFMTGAVPARLRNRALRKLWLTNPVLANLDELIDYGEDYTDAATVVENLQTAWKVGKGFLKDEPDTEDAGGEDSPQALDEPAPEDAAEDDAVADASPDEVPALQGEDSPKALDEPADAEIAVLTLSETPEPVPAPRRMRFRFESG